MRHYRSHSLLLSAAAAAIACGGAGGDSDPRIASIHTGLTRDSVMRILAVDSSGRGGFVQSRERFLANGQHWEVLFYDSRSRSERDSVPSSELIPVILHEDTVVGSGWTEWDRVVSANGLLRTRPSPAK